MKEELQTFLGSSVDQTVETWCKNHGKDYLQNTEDVLCLVYRYEKYLKKSRVWSFAAAAVTSVIVGIITPKEDIISFIALILLSSLLIGGICKFTLFDIVEERKLFKSIKAFMSDWSVFKTLILRTECDEYHLKALGQEIYTAERRLDVKTKKTLKKKFDKEHGVLYRFGRCEKDWGIYIPNQKSQEKSTGAFGF